LIPALQAFLRDSEHGTGVACVLTYDSAMQWRRLAPQDERLLYQLAREAVGNALRHAAANTITVGLTLTETGSAQLVVQDDGQGFVPQPLGRTLAAGHLGLALMHERVRERDGRVQIATSRDTGTTITIAFPLVT